MSSRSRIWYLIGTLSVGGAERTLVDLANELDRERYDVTIWTILEPGPLAVDVAEHVSIRSLDAKGKTDLTAPIRFVRALRDEKPDILQSFLFWDNTLATLSGVASPNTTVITGVRAVPNDPSKVRSLVRRGTVKLADHIVSNSAAGAEFIARYGADRSSVSVIRNGRDLTAYRDGEANSELYESLELQPDVPIVGTVGRLIERKGHYDLLDAWVLVQADHPDAQLILVGDGPESDALEEHALELGVSDSVHFLGTRDDIPALLDLMDVFVFPSHFEGLPGALLEAMAAGLPIVATPVDGNSELVTDGESGLLVPVKSPDRLAEAVSELLCNREHAIEVDETAQRVAHEDFALERMVGEFEELYVGLNTGKEE